MSSCGGGAVVVAGAGVTVVVQAVPEAVVSGTVAAGHVVAAGAQAAGVVAGVVLLDEGVTAEGHAGEEALTQLPRVDPFTDVVILPPRPPATFAPPTPWPTPHGRRT